MLVRGYDGTGPAEPMPPLVQQIQQLRRRDDGDLGAQGADGERRPVQAVGLHVHPAAAGAVVLGEGRAKKTPAPVQVWLAPRNLKVNPGERFVVKVQASAERPMPSLRSFISV